MSDADAILLYATENALQRGESTTADTGTVAAAVWFLAGHIMRGNVRQTCRTLSAKQAETLQGQIASPKGLGRDFVCEWLAQVPGNKLPFNVVGDYFAAIKAGITHAEVFVKDNMSDAEAVLVYATENATQDGNRASAMAGAVASATWLLARDAARKEVSEISDTYGWTKQEAVQLKTSFESTTGIGGRSVSHFMERVPGFKRPAVDDYFANIKSCGEYAKIIADVRKEIDDELAEELRKAEAAELFGVFLPPRVDERTYNANAPHPGNGIRRINMPIHCKIDDRCEDQ